MIFVDQKCDYDEQDELREKVRETTYLYTEICER